jgi:glucose/arabinose dehydrogenase
MDREGEQMQLAKSRTIRLAALAISLSLIALVQPGVAGAKPAKARPARAASPFASKIVVRTVKAGLNGPAGFTFAPSGLIYFLERGTGRVRTYNPTTKKLSTVYTIPRVEASGERGALGIALNPGWPAVPYAYIYVTRRTTATSPLRNQLVRIKVSKGKGSGFKILLSEPTSSSPYHNGGRILFGPDHKLYLFIGENHNSANSQNLKNLQGKMLRMNAPGDGTDGTAAPGDFKGRVFAYGMRNSFGFTFDSATRLLWETENGPECNDEINIVRLGRNLGWGPNENCSGSHPQDTNNSGPKPRILPQRFFVSTLGITGDAICHGCGLGAGNEGRLFFGCVNDGILRSVAFNAARTHLSGPIRSVLTVPGGIYSMEVSPKGQIYFSNASGIFRLALG